MSNQSQPDDLAALFPNLAPIVQDWKNNGGNGGNDPLANNGEHSGLTDADIEAYFASRPGFRAPLPSPVTTPPTFQSGQGAPPPPAAHVEPSEGAPVPPVTAPVPPATAPAQATSAPAEGGQQGDETFTEPPADLFDLSTLPEEINLGDHRLPRDKIAGLAALNNLLDSDPRLRNIVAEYMTTGVVPQVPQTYPPYAPGGVGQPSPGTTIPGQGPVVQPAAVPPTQLPGQLGQYVPQPPPEEIADDPVLRTMWEQSERNNAALHQMAVNQQLQQQQYAVQQQQQFNAVTDSAISSFKETRQLNDEQINRVVKVAADLNVVNSFLQGFDPITGVPMPADTHTAVTKALDLAYHTLPEFQAREFEQRQRQHVEDTARKQKLSAIGGGGTSAPRSPSAPRNAQESHAALMSEVSQMLSGNWSPPNQ